MKMNPWTVLAGALLAGVGAVLPAAVAIAQATPATGLLEQVISAMGGRERLQRVDTLVYTGFGQDAYMDGGGNITADLNSPPKWRAIADAQRSIDLGSHRAVLQQRRAPMFPFAAPFGLNWNRASSQQSGAELLDHPLFDGAVEPSARGPVRVHDAPRPERGDEGRVLADDVVPERLELLLERRARRPGSMLQIEGHRRSASAEKFGGPRYARSAPDAIAGDPRAALRDDLDGAAARRS